MGALKCTIILDKAEGMTLVVEDEAASAKQTVTLLKDSIVLQVEGSLGRSTVTQGAESVVIKCKKFSVEADEIECRSQQASTYAAQTSLTLSGDQAVKASGTEVTCSATTLGLKATGDLTAEASGVTNVKGAIVNVSAPQVALG